MSCHNFLTSLILTNQEMPVEYKLTCFHKTFAVFSPFSFTSHCLYSAYILLIVSLLALSTLSRVHLCPNKCAFPLSMTLFKHSHFLCYSMPSFGVSTISPKKSLSFNIFPTSAIAFITGLNLHHMKNYIRYNSNTNNPFVIIFFKSTQQKLPSDGTLLGRTSERFLWCWLLLLFSSQEVFHSFSIFNLLLFFIHFCSSFCCCCSSFHFQAAFPCHRHSTLASQAREGLHQLWTLTQLLLIAFAFSSTMGATVLSGRFSPTGIFYLMLLHQHFWLKLRLSRPPWEPAVLPLSLQGLIMILETKVQPICLFDSQ